MAGESRSPGMSPSLAGQKDGAVRIRDVADLAGVSMGTVSNTLNHPERVRPQTREAVRAAIRTLGFEPNQQARVLTGASSRVIGLLILDVASPFFMQAAGAVERAAREAGHVVMLCNSDNDPEREAELLRMLAGHRVRGVLMTPSPTGEHPRRSRRSSIVYLDYDAGDQECSVSVDHEAGAHLAVSHLLSMGHQRIAFVGGPPRLPQMMRRRAGAMRAIEDAGLDPREALVDIDVPGMGISAGLAAVSILRDAGLPTGVFCGNDMIAFGVYRGLVRAGIHVPKDVALVGYDDIEFAADWVVPLTSVRQPTDELGYLAAQLLLEHTAPGHQAHRRVVLQPELVVRQSSDPNVRAQEPVLG